MFSVKSGLVRQVLAAWRPTIDEPWIDRLENGADDGFFNAVFAAERDKSE